MKIYFYVSSRNFSFNPYIGSFINFELILCMVWGRNHTSFFCIWTANCSSTTNLFNPKLKRSLSLLGTFVEKQRAIHRCIYLWTLSASPLICPMPHCLDYFICIYSFVLIVSFKSCLKFSESLLPGSSCILFGESRQRPEAQEAFL